MYHQYQCAYDYGNAATFWPVRGLPMNYWHWNQYNGSDNGLQPGCYQADLGHHRRRGRGYDRVALHSMGR